MRREAKESGFTLLQLLITLAVIAIVSTFAFMGINTARAAMRLSNSTRQFGAYVERARADAVRRHGQTTVQMLTNTTYSVTMDFADSGNVTTQTFPLETNVTFITSLQTITFDWRGRIVDEISVGFGNESGTGNVNITGSGDVTIDSEIFHDASIPQVTYSANVSGDVIADVLPSPSPTSTPTATPSPSPTVSPTPDPNATPTPTPTPTPHPGHSPTPTPTPTPEPTPTPSPSPGGTPTPSSCSIVATPGSLTIVQNGSGNIVVALNNFSGTATIKATSSNTGQIQVSPLSKKVTGSASATFTVTVKKASGSVTFSSSCGSQSVNINVP